MRAPRVELLFRIASTAFASRNFKLDGVHNLNMAIRFDNEVMRRFYPAAWDAPWHAGLRTLSRDVAVHGLTQMRTALAFVRGADLRDQGGVKAFTLELAREVARADLAFIGRVKAVRREMEARIAACGGPLTGHRTPVGMPPWAAETGRLGSSIGLELSTEQLPEPHLP